jgi:hypothetical protein
VFNLARYRKYCAEPQSSDCRIHTGLLTTMGWAKQQ